MEDCIFCRIAAGKIPTEVRYQDEEVLAFPDIHPKAPTHLIIIPKKHIPSLNDVSQAELLIVAKMMKAAQVLAKEAGIVEKGYKLVLNVGRDGGQVVPHMHLHLLGGRRISTIV
ncbi:MAG: histidine triad nucleotide-binding protein [Chloroflexota bacterium]